MLGLNRNYISRPRSGNQSKCWSWEQCHWTAHPGDSVLSPNPLDPSAAFGCRAGMGLGSYLAVGMSCGSRWRGNWAASLVWCSTDTPEHLFGLFFLPCVDTKGLCRTTGYCRELIDFSVRSSGLFLRVKWLKCSHRLPSKQWAVGFAWLPVKNPKLERQENKQSDQKEMGFWHRFPLCWLGCETDPEK